MFTNIEPIITDLSENIVSEIEMPKSPILSLQKKSSMNSSPKIGDVLSKEELPKKQKTLKLKKISKKEETKEIPTIYNIHNTKNHNYSVIELKQYLREHGLHVTGTKPVLHSRLFDWLSSIRGTIKLQALYRGHLVRSVTKLFSKYQNMVNNCVNDADFYTFEPLKEIPKFQLICLQDPDGKNYGFDISSIFQYQRKLDEGTPLTNPYNRNKVSNEFLSELSKIVYASSHGWISTSVNNASEEEEEYKLSFEKRVELRAVKVFQHINSLGNYSDMNWFMSLSRRNAIILVRQLYDIWNYRLMIPSTTRREICPPTGNPFLPILNVDLNSLSVKELQNSILGIFEELVFRGNSRDLQYLGASYLLGALTLVNENAANSMPWLYQSFAY